MPPDWKALTITSNIGLLAVIESPCRISAAFDPTTDPQPPQSGDLKAVWDTGATGSVVTQNVVDALGLKPISLAQVHGVHSTETSEVFLVALFLPNAVGFPKVRVTKGRLANNVDVLVGMDVITVGDFSITNKNGQTIFSFRVPSQHHVDYVAQHDREIKIEQVATQHAGRRGKQKKKSRR